DTRRAGAKGYLPTPYGSWLLVPPRSDRTPDVIEAFSQSDDAVIAVASARALALWSMSDLHRERSVPRAYATASLAMRGTTLATAETRGTIELWDTERLEPIPIGSHPGVRSVLFTDWLGE